MVPPALVEPREVSEPSGARERSVAVEGSKETEADELEVGRLQILIACCEI